MRRETERKKGLGAEKERDREGKTDTLFPHCKIMIDWSRCVSTSARSPRFKMLSLLHLQSLSTNCDLIAI